MATELFKPEQTLKEINAELMEHLNENASVTINGDGKTSFYIPDNGDCSFWFDNLVKTILQKTANQDKEIIKLCVESEIDLFDVSIKKLSGGKK